MNEASDEIEDVVNQGAKDLSDLREAASTIINQMKAALRLFATQKRRSCARRVLVVFVMYLMGYTRETIFFTFT
mgnify:CR=1 FL=1